MNKIFYVLFGLIAVGSIAGLSTEFVDFEVQDFQFFGSFAEFDEAVCTCKGDDGTFSKENCQQFDGDITDPNGVCVLHQDVDLDDYGTLPALDQGCGVGFWKSHADESQVLSTWPVGYNPNDSYNELFKTTIENTNQENELECIMNIAPEFGGCTAEQIAKKNQKVRDEDKDKEKESRGEDEVKDEDVEVRDEDEASKEDAEIRDENEDVEVKELTLLEALNAKGGKMGHLLRVSAAALLNSAHSEISYQYPVHEVISMTQDAIDSENYQETIQIFEELNEKGVKPPLCGDFDENKNSP